MLHPFGRQHGEAQRLPRLAVADSKGFTGLIA
jgi:hypothetical protein